MLVCRSILFAKATLTFDVFSGVGDFCSWEEKSKHPGDIEMTFQLKQPNFDAESSGITDFANRESTGQHETNLFPIRSATKL